MCLLAKLGKARVWEFPVGLEIVPYRVRGPCRD